MPVGWLIDADVFDAYHDELAAAVTRNGHTVVSVNRPNPPYLWDDVDCSYRDAFPEGACVVTHADIDLVTRVLDEGRWSPGAFATMEHFCCSHYYAHLGRFLLNRDYVMLPFAELPRCLDFLLGSLGRDDRLFVRPDSPFKTFSGLTISRSTFAKDYDFMGFYEFPTESLVVVSSPKTITCEWRFVVADGQIVTGSHYKQDGELMAQLADDPVALKLARSVAATGFAPDPAWVLDICRTEDGEYHLLEIGCFSFANLYGCDKDLVVKAVSAVAERVHGAQMG